jgi:hypothetical protein
MINGAVGYYSSDRPSYSNEKPATTFRSIELHQRTNKRLRALLLGLITICLFGASGTTTFAQSAIPENAQPKSYGTGWECKPGFREFTVAVLEGADTQLRQIMPIEIIPPVNLKGDRILGFAEKRSNEEEIRPVEEPLFSAVSALASAAFTALGARDFSRIDIKLDETGKPHFLEANLVPGMTPETSYFPRTFSSTMTSNNAAHKAMTEKEIVWRIVELGLMRAKSTAPVSGIPVC